MCLAVPGKIVELKENNLAEIDLMGARREVSLDLLSDVSTGDYVLVHAGFAISVIGEQEAQKTLSLIEELAFYEQSLS